ncbi:hypothetical protein Aperf_G00000051509 [Anoplocephala perfoliata]
MSRKGNMRHSKRSDADLNKNLLDEEEELDYGETDDEVDARSSREEGEAYSEEDEGSSDDNANSLEAELREREYRHRLALRKAEREAEASKEAALGRHIPPRSKFDSPDRTLDIEYPVPNDVEKSNLPKSASASGFPIFSSSSNSGGESGFVKHSRKRSHEPSLDRNEVPSKKASTSFAADSSSHQGHYHRRHHRSHQKISELQKELTHKQGKSDPSIKPLSSRHRSRSSSKEKSKPSESALIEPTSLNSRLPPGRAPIIDGSRLKYLEEVEDDEDEDEYANIEAEVYGGEDGELLRTNGVEMEVEEIPQRERTPVKPFYLPSIQGSRSVDEFECLNRIEEGTYGVVYRARDKKTNEVVALKRLKMEKEREGFPITSLREINTLMKAQHENIIVLEYWARDFLLSMLKS